MTFTILGALVAGYLCALHDRQAARVRSAQTTHTTLTTETQR